MCYIVWDGGLCQKCGVDLFLSRNEVSKWAAAIPFTRDDPGMSWQDQKVLASTGNLNGQSG